MATERKDGGPAYPARAVPLTDWGGNDVTSGMSLRDFFAGQAIAGAAYMLGITGPVTAAMDRRSLCESAYAIADAMLAAREGK